MSENHTTTATKVTAERSIHLEDHVSTKTVRREIHKSNILGTAAIAKAPITEKKKTAKRRKRWRDDHKTWAANDWKS